MAKNNGENGKEILPFPLTAVQLNYNIVQYWTLASNPYKYASYLHTVSVLISSIQK